MRRVRKFLSLPLAEKLLFFVALVIVITMRLGLTFTSYNFLKRLIPVVVAQRSADTQRTRAVAVAVSRSARIVPAATCLTQALAGQLLLAAQGYASLIRVGVARQPDGAIVAHAWLLADDVVLLGGGAQNRATYKVLTDLKSK